MARQKKNSDEFGQNRLAVEAIIDDLEERELLNVADGPLVEVARSLASSVDNQPGSSQLAMQYRAAVDQLRREVQRVQDDAVADLNWRLWTGCKSKDHHRDQAHCAQCCEATRDIDALEDYRPGPKHRWEGRAAGEPVKEISDQQYAWLEIREFLTRWPRVPMGDRDG